MQLPTVAVILSLAALGSAQLRTSVVGPPAATTTPGCQNGKYSLQYLE
jgi:hypothetical protein